ncbi:ExbD/TolR family protein [Corallincola platygyrae]|uniref:ExbD/TolR family protein n=1 Tax=Corallincola platygyrae TaxID=1193278 RepID=A0ABW4XLI8_9GAMM
MIQTQERASLSTSIELTPLIDIVFIVVVFLLLTANSRLLSLPVDIPSSDSVISESVVPSKPLTITLKETAPFFAIDQQTYEHWDAFKLALVQRLKDKEQPINIAADRESQVEPLLKLMALLNQHQVQNTHILMEESRP